MRFFYLDCVYNGMRFRLGKISGALHRSHILVEDAATRRIPESAKVQNAIRLCATPYALKPLSSSKWILKSPPETSQHQKRAIKVAKHSIWLCNRHFYLAQLWASWRTPIFDSATEAIHFFRAQVGGDQSSLCLPRSLFAAKTSRRFAENGVLVIGASLPARSMHAWVIENNALADPWDNGWVNYQPVAALA